MASFVERTRQAAARKAQEERQAAQARQQQQRQEGRPTGDEEDEEDEEGRGGYDAKDLAGLKVRLECGRLYSGGGRRGQVMGIGVQARSKLEEGAQGGLPLQGRLGSF